MGDNMKLIFLLLAALLTTGCEKRKLYEDTECPIYIVNVSCMEYPHRKGEYYPGENKKMHLLKAMTLEEYIYWFSHEQLHVVADVCNHDPEVIKAHLETMKLLFPEKYLQFNHDSLEEW